MLRSIKTLAIASVIVAGLAIAPALYAHDSGESGGAMTGPGMMGQGGMMGMMGQMSEMMEGCNQMMQSMSGHGSGKPNQQWRENAPDTDKRPNKDG